MPYVYVFNHRYFIFHFMCLDGIDYHEDFENKLLESIEGARQKGLVIQLIIIFILVVILLSLYIVLLAG